MKFKLVIIAVLILALGIAIGWNSAPERVVYMTQGSVACKPRTCTINYRGKSIDGKLTFYENSNIVTVDLKDRLTDNTGHVLGQAVVMSWDLTTGQASAVAVHPAYLARLQQIEGVVRVWPHDYSIDVEKADIFEWDADGITNQVKEILVEEFNKDNNDGADPPPKV